MESKSIPVTARLHATSSASDIEFSALVHELSGRLATIAMMCGQLSAGGARNEATWIDRMQRIHLNAASAHRIIKAIDRLYDSSPLEFVNFDLTEMTTRVARDLMEREPAYARAVLKIQSHVQMHADPDQMQIVLDNLIGNALKFSSSQEAPEIHVTATRESDSVVVHVSDNGVGLAQEDSARIFETFTRCHPQFEGCGVGLALVRDIVRRHGGQVWAKGEPGAGCTVSFSVRQ